MTLLVERMFYKQVIFYFGGSVVRVERARYDNGFEKWLLIDNEFNPVEETLLFTNHLYASGYSPNTIEGYLRDLKKYLEYLNMKNIDFYSVKPLDISEFLQYIVCNQEGDEKSANTVNRTIASIASCYNYHQKVLNTCNSPMVSTRILRSGSMSKSMLYHAIDNKGSVNKSYFRRKTKKRGLHRLSRDQVKRVFEMFTNPRDKLILKVLYYTGLRIGELLGLRIEDYESPCSADVGAIYVVFRSENKAHQRQKTGNRVVHVPMELLYEIDEYVTCDRPYVSGIANIFVSRKGPTKGQPLTRKAIQKLFRLCSEKSGVEFTPHTLRHTHFTELTEFGYDEAFLKERGGWAKIDSASAYLHPSAESQRKAFQRFWEVSKKHNV